MSELVLVAMIGGAVTVIPATIAAVWKWSQAVEQRAYERARNEALLREAQATIAQKESEINTVKAELATTAAELHHEREVLQPRLYSLISSLQATIDRITAEGAL